MATIGYIYEVAAIRPSDMNTDLDTAKDSAVHHLESTMQQHADALLQGRVKGRGVDHIAAKEDITKIFLVVQPLTGTDVTKEDQALAQFSGFFAPDGSWRKEFIVIQEIWPILKDPANVARYGKLPKGYEQIMADLDHGITELGNMVESWRLVWEHMANLPEPGLDDDIEALKAYNQKFQTALIAFMKAFSYEDVDDSLKAVTEFCKQERKKSSRSTFRLAGPFIFNSFLPPLYALQKPDNADLFVTLARAFQKAFASSTDVEKQALAKGTQLKNVDFHLAAVQNMAAIAAAGLKYREEDVVSHFDVIDVRRPTLYTGVLGSLASAGLASGPADPENIFEGWMTTLCYQKGSAISLGMYWATCENALSIAPKSDPPTYMFRFGIPDDWADVYKLQISYDD